MINASDILHLPYTPDLTEGGIGYTLRSLASSSILKKEMPVENLHMLVGSIAAGLAFRRSLAGQEIPFQVLGAAPFTQPHRYDVSLGGHRCELNCSLVTHRPQIAALRKDSASAMRHSALLPIDQFSAEGHKPDDIHIFALLLGLLALSSEELDRAAAAGQPVCLVHLLPAGWSCPPDWLPLEELALKSEGNLPVTLELGGLNSGRAFCTTRLELLPKKRVVVEQCFHSLAYVDTAHKPEGRIGLHSPTRGETLIIPARAWDNLWVYGMDILLVGWLSHEEFRRKAKVLNAGMHTFQGERTREKNLLVPMEELNPLRPLLQRVKAWAAPSRNPDEV